MLNVLEKLFWNVQRKSDEETKPLFYDIGIEFVDLTEEDKVRIRKVVKLIVDNTKSEDSSS